MTEQNNELFKCVLTMDYKLQTGEKSPHRNLYIKAGNKVEARDKILQRLNNGNRNKTFVSFRCAQTGDIAVLHSMKVGDIHITEAES